MSTIDMPEGVTHWACSKMNVEQGRYEKQLWGPPGKAAVGSWKVPEKGNTLAKRCRDRWGAGVYRLFFQRSVDGKRQGAGHIEIRIDGLPPAGPPAPPYPYPYPYPPPGHPPAAPHAAMPAPGVPPGYPYGYAGNPLAPPFDPLGGFSALFNYAKVIRGEERDDARTTSDRYRVDTEAMIARERLASEERQRDRESMQREREEQRQREHDLQMKRIEAELSVTREALAGKAKDEKEALETVLERLESIDGELEEAKNATATIGQQAMGMLQVVVDKVGGPLGEAVAQAVKNGRPKAVPAG